MPTITAQAHQEVQRSQPDGPDRMKEAGNGCGSPPAGSGRPEVTWGGPTPPACIQPISSLNSRSSPFPCGQSPKPLSALMWPKAPASTNDAPRSVANAALHSDVAY